MEEEKLENVAQVGENIETSGKIRILSADFADHPEFEAKFNLSQNKVFTDIEDKKAFWQVLDQIDGAIKEDNAKNPRLSKDRITIEISDKNETIPLQIKLGEDYFEKNDLDKLIAKCSNDLSKKSLSPETKKEFALALERIKPDEKEKEQGEEKQIGTAVEQVGKAKSRYAHPADKDRLNGIIGSSLETSQGLGQTTGDEAMRIFVQNMNSVYRNLASIGKNKDQLEQQEEPKGNEKSKEKENTLGSVVGNTVGKATENIVDEAMNQTFKSFAKSIAGKFTGKVWDKGKERELSNNKDMGLNR